MLSRIDNIWRLSMATFPKSQTGVYSFNEETFANLKNEMDLVTAADVCLEESLNERKITLERMSGSNATHFKANAPVTYIDVYSGPSFSIGIFVLHDGSRMPIHDHPYMHGILKVLAGEIKLDSYNIVCEEPNQGRRKVVVAEKSSTIVQATDPACVLTPRENNLHSLSPVNGSAAFMDILSPPYFCQFSNVLPNPCNYYREGDVKNYEGPKVYVQLLRTPSQRDYWCDVAKYKGPTLPNSRF